MTTSLLAALAVIRFLVPADADYYRLTARQIARHYGADPDLVECICAAESGWNPNAYNKAEGAAGLGQWREESWRVARKAMGADADLTLRFDPIENIVTTCYAMGRGWEHWWLNANAMCQQRLDKNANIE